MKPRGFMDIPGYENRYAVNRFGLIYSYGHRGRFALEAKTKNPRPTMLSQMPDKKGYLTVMLRDSLGVQRRLFVHYLVLITFVGPRPIGKETDHENRIVSDNRLSNLRWLTKSGNSRNCLRTSRYTKFRGLAFNNGIRKKWRAQCVDKSGVVRFTRQMMNEREAAIAYDRLSVSLLGAQAITNKSLGLL